MNLIQMFCIFLIIIKAPIMLILFLTTSLELSSVLNNMFTFNISYSKNKGEQALLWNNYYMISSDS